MELKVSTIPDQPLSLNVNKHWSGNGHNLYFLPQFEKEARLMISNFIPYLTPYEGEYVRLFFSAEVIISNTGNTWDTEKDALLALMTRYLIMQQK